MWEQEGARLDVRYVNGRLVHFGRPSTVDAWTEHWTGADAEPARGGRRIAVPTVDAYAREFEKQERLLRLMLTYLPRGEPILDGGCGPGGWVLLLRQHGLDVWGLDWSAEAMLQTRDGNADLPLIAGDALRLPFPTGCFGGYLSIGLANLFEDGPDPLLREIHRVLRPGGVLIISVPCVNPLRRALAALGRYSRQPCSGPFAQYYYAPLEFRARLERTGFVVQELTLYDAWYGLTREVPGAALLLNLVRGRPPRPSTCHRTGAAPSAGGGAPPWRRLARRVLHSDLLNRYVGHLVAFVAVRGED